MRAPSRDWRCRCLGGTCAARCARALRSRLGISRCTLAPSAHRKSGPRRRRRQGERMGSRRQTLRAERPGRARGVLLPVAAATVWAARAGAPAASSPAAGRPWCASCWRRRRRHRPPAPYCCGVDLIGEQECTSAFDGKRAPATVARLCSMPRMMVSIPPVTAPPRLGLRGCVAATSCHHHRSGRGARADVRRGGMQRRANRLAPREQLNR